MEESSAQELTAQGLLGEGTALAVLPRISGQRPGNSDVELTQQPCGLSGHQAPLTPFPQPWFPKIFWLSGKTGKYEETVQTPNWEES